MSNNTFDHKRNFRRLITKTNSGSLTPERTAFLKEQINDPNYINLSIEMLAGKLSEAFSDGYLADHIAD